MEWVKLRNRQELNLTDAQNTHKVSPRSPWRPLIGRGFTFRANTHAIHYTKIFYTDFKSESKPTMSGAMALSTCNLLMVKHKKRKNHDPRKDRDSCPSPNQISDWRIFVNRDQEANLALAELKARASLALRRAAVLGCNTRREPALSSFDTVAL